MTLRKLLSEACPDFAAPAWLPDIVVRGLECDSRKVEAGFLFIAIRGVKQDGSRFIREAVERGASAIVGDVLHGLEEKVPCIRIPESRLAAARLAAVFYGRPTRHLKVLGITGTNGKTTSSYLLEHLLEYENQKTGVIGTVNYRYDGRVFSAVETTPGPLRLQRLLAEMAGAGCQYAVLEVSSHALDQNRVHGIDFEAGLFTNLTQDHLDYHGSMETYFKCKASLFKGLGKNCHAVLNEDDPWSAKLRTRTVAKIHSFGLQKNSDWMAENISLSLKATEFDLVGGRRRSRVSIPLVGTHNLYNALGALAVVDALGFDGHRLARGLAGFRGVPGRLEAVNGGQNFHVYVDFAHTPDGLRNVLSSLLPYRRRRLLLVFGCGGDRDRGKRPQMARIAGEFCDFVLITSDNPRSEDPKAIADEICAGFPGEFKNYAVVLDRRRAVRQVLLSAREGDIVLLAGKGHETTQLIGKDIIPFSDREEAEKALHGH